MMKKNSQEEKVHEFVDDLFASMGYVTNVSVEEFRQIITSITGAIDTNFEAIEKKCLFIIDRVDENFISIENEFKRLNKKIEALEQKINEGK